MYRLPAVANEPLQSYSAGSEEREQVLAAIKALRQRLPVQVPLIINGREWTSDSKRQQCNPSDRSVLAEYSLASEEQVQLAIDGALAAKQAWEDLAWHERASVFLKAAELISGKYRYELMAAAMLGQGKNIWQAEIDAAAELIDFLRFNCKFAEQLYAMQPSENAPGIWNRTEYRPLEGFVYAVAPFNFTAIAGNLAAAPALMGNVVLLKPSPSAVYSNYLLCKVFAEAGLPAGVIQFLPGDADAVTDAVLASGNFAALHFTGSTAVFKSLYQKIATNLDLYRSYPRIVGETGGKNFHLVHSSAHLENAVVNTVRAAFEYQGQKCSACSRAYVSRTLWEQGFRERLIEETSKLGMGPPETISNFVGPVIHAAAFERLRDAIDLAKSQGHALLTGGACDDSKGYFVQPTVIEVKDPQAEIMTRELFGPVLAVYIFEDDKFEQIVSTIDATSPYGLTGSIFAADREVIARVSHVLRHAAGNFYINDKCTGAVVSQQPFGGARSSGTNDKAGSMALLWRFVSLRSLKENMIDAQQVLYASNLL